MKFLLNYLREFGRVFAFLFLFFFGFVLSGLAFAIIAPMLGERSLLFLAGACCLLVIGSIIAGFVILFKKPERLSLREQRLKVEAKRKRLP